MTAEAFIATRKGLFELTKQEGAWMLSAPHFPGDPVSIVLHDQRDGTTYAALSLGHFGTKLHVSDDAGARWTEVPAPAEGILSEIVIPEGQTVAVGTILAYIGPSDGKAAPQRVPRAERFAQREN